MCLGRPESSAVDAGFGEGLLELLHGPANVGLAALAMALQLPGDLAVGVGVHGLEGEVLELPLDLPDAEAVGQGRVDLSRLTRDALLLGRRQGAERAHVVEPVGQLDEDDADVLRHGQEHLADVLRLLLLMGQGAELAELGDAVDEACDIRAEVLLDVGERGLRVFRDVVKQRRRDGHRVQPHLGQDAGHGQGVGDVRLAAGPLLLGMRLVGEGEGGGHGRQVGLRVATLELLLDVPEGPQHAVHGVVHRRPWMGAPTGSRLGRAGLLGDGGAGSGPCAGHRG